MVKALFFGLGSIGQRHLRNFQLVTKGNGEIFVYRRTAHNLIIKDGMAEQCESLADYYNFKQFDTIDKAFEQKPDLVIITNPTANHLSTAIIAANNGCHLFIEKPLADSMDNIEELSEIVNKKKLVVLVCYQTRFHPCYKETKNILDSNKYGHVISARFEWGTYLPDHHRYEDYRKGYAARKDLGGGVILGLSHELDLIYSLFGMPQEIKAIGGKLSNLSINVDDTVLALMGYNKRSHFFVSLFLSYAQTKEYRGFTIQLDRGTIFCDLNANQLTVFNNEGHCEIARKFDVGRNTLFIEEMENFLKACRGECDPAITLDDGIKSLELGLKIKALLI